MESLERALEDFDDLVEDLQVVGSRSSQPVFEKLVDLLDTPPLSLLIASNVPPFDFNAWLEQGRSTMRAQLGSATLNWPRDLGEKIAARIGCCRLGAAKEQGFLEFAWLFLSDSVNYDGRLLQFIDVVVRPLRQDLDRLAERRLPPVALDNVFMSGFPLSGDSQLDEMLQLAIHRFRDKSPVTRKAGLEKLWDAWERLRTLLGDDKKASIKRLLDAAADSDPMRAVLEAEATALNGIGNAFNIRHFERNKTPITRTTLDDYLFHRLSAIIQLILSSRQGDGGPQ